MPSGWRKEEPWAAWGGGPLARPPARRGAAPGRPPGGAGAAPAEIDAFQDFAVAEGWSDGLPVLPPTEERVARLLGGLAARRGEAVATPAPRRGRATLQAIPAHVGPARGPPERHGPLRPPRPPAPRPRLNPRPRPTTAPPP